jgi:glycosyltransferase 2 family protein
LFQDPHAVSTWEAAKALNIGLLFNSFLPSRAGEVPRTFALARSTGQSKLEIAGTIVVERLLDLFSVAVVGVVIWPWLPDEGWINALCVICALIVVGSVAVAVATWLLRRSAVSLAERALRRLPFVSEERAAEFVASLARGVRAVREPRRLVLALSLSALVWVMTYLSIVTLYPAFDIPVSSASPWLIVVVTSLAMTVPSTAGGLGVYEAAVQSALVATGVASGLALSFALTLHAVNLVPIALTGAIAGWASAVQNDAIPRSESSS